MSRFDGLRHRLYVLFRGDRYADEVRRELRFHRELDALADHGNSLGNETYYREEVRRMTLQLWIDRVLQDLTYAIRGLRRSRGFTAAVAIILGLGIGVNAAMFSILDRVFMRQPEGVVHPTEIRRLFTNVRVRDMNGNDGRHVSYGLPYPYLTTALAVADPSIGLAAYTGLDSILLRSGRDRIPARRVLVTDNYFSTLGVTARYGRLFAPSEYALASPTPLAVISDALWERGFHRDPSVLGRVVKIAEKTFTIVGVATPGFAGIDLDAADVWSPANNFEGHGTEPWYRTFQAQMQIFGRVPTAAAETRLIAATQTVFRPMRVEHWMQDSTLRVVTGPMLQALGPIERGGDLLVTLRIAGVSLMVLLIVVANVLNLLLLRAQRRRREIAVRRALGVSRGRLLHQTTVESLLLALIGGTIAVLFAIWTDAALRHVVFPDAHWVGRSISGRTVLFVAALSIAIGFVGGLTPLLGAFREELAGELKAGMNNGGYRGSRTRNALVALQAALCVVLLVGAGLFARSLDAVRGIGTGFAGTTQFFANAQYDEPATHYKDIEPVMPQVLDRIQALPDVEAVGATSIAPLYGFSWTDIFVQGRDSTYKLDGEHFATVSEVTPGFFGAVGLRIIAGRAFSAADSRDAPRVAVVSATMAHDLWPNESALGKCLYLDKRDAPCSTVIGVAADARRMRIIERAGSHFYAPSAQRGSAARTVVVRARDGHVASAIRETEAILRQYLPAMAGMRIQTFDSLTERELRPWRLGRTLFMALAGLALVVAAIGVYAVIAYGAAQRTREVGIRLALGARTADVVDLILGDGLRVIAIGIAIGLGLALAFGYTVRSLLFGIEPNDLSVLIGSATILCIVGATASLVPGLRAARIDPNIALRAE